MNQMKKENGGGVCLLFLSLASVFQCEEVFGVDKALSHYELRLAGTNQSINVERVKLTN